MKNLKFLNLALISSTFALTSCQDDIKAFFFICQTTKTDATDYQ